MTACKQNEARTINASEYFLLLDDKKTVSLNTYGNNEIEESKIFAISEKSIFTTDQKERVAILDTGKNTVMLYEIHTSKEIKLSIPYDINPKSILINEDNLFIGGGFDDEDYRYDRKKPIVMLIQYHIQSRKWYQLEVPTQVMFYRKAIDDLLVYDNLLIAIDNIIEPKYILFYQLNTSKKLAFSHLKQLYSNGTYEHISQGRITPHYLGLRSSTYGRAGGANHITIYKRLDLTKSFAISVLNDFSKNGIHTFNDFLIIENTIVIASAENGLGYFEIKDSYFNNDYEFPQASGGAFTSFTNIGFNAQVNVSKISYTKYKNENIIRLTQIPNTKKVVLTIKYNNENIRHEVIEI